MQKLSIILTILIFSTFILGQTNYQTYSNARYGYAISYPSDLLTPQGEAENGDGQIFKNKDAEMRVWGSHNALRRTLKQEYQAGSKDYGRGITYQALLKNSFVISGRRGGKIFYQKTIFKDDQFFTLTIEYKESKRQVYDSVVTKIAKSFKV